MVITPKETNIVILYGNGAVSLYPRLLSVWARTLPADQWKSFHFILTGTINPSTPSNDAAFQAVAAYVRKARFFRIPGNDSEEADPHLNSESLHSDLFDKVSKGKVQIHVMYDPGEKECSLESLRRLVGAATTADGIPFPCLYYLYLGKNSTSDEKKELADLLKAYPGPAFLLGDIGLSGARVSPDECQQAAILAILANAAKAVPIHYDAYTLGYSALNMNGNEQHRLAEYFACRYLLDHLQHPIDTNTPGFDLAPLLPEGAGTPDNVYQTLLEYVRTNLPPFPKEEIDLEWVTGLVKAEDPKADVRLLEMISRHYDKEKIARPAAIEYTEKEATRLMRYLRSNITTAAFSASVLEGIVAALNREIAEAASPFHFAYIPSRPINSIINFFQKKKFSFEILNDVYAEIQRYIERQNVLCFLEELVKIYNHINQWIQKAANIRETSPWQMTAQEFLKSVLDGKDSENTRTDIRLLKKYPAYSAKLEAVRPSLPELTKGSSGDYYHPDATIVTQSWQYLVRIAGRNLESMLEPEFRGDYCTLLNAEKPTPEARKKFFDDYLQACTGFFCHPNARVESVVRVFLVDSRFTDNYLKSLYQFEVRTDNVESLAVYSLSASNDLCPKLWFLEESSTNRVRKQPGKVSEASTAEPPSDPPASQKPSEKEPSVSQENPPVDKESSLSAPKERPQGIKEVDKETTPVENHPCVSSNYVFISYSSRKQAYADAMRALLNHQGIATWMAPGDIPPGDTYTKVIVSAIKKCSCFLILLSNEALDSTWVLNETERAVNYNRPVIPVQMENVVINDKFELMLSTNQVIAIPRIDTELEEVQRLLNSIRAFLGMPQDRQ